MVGVLKCKVEVVLASSGDADGGTGGDGGGAMTIDQLTGVRNGVFDASEVMNITIELVRRGYSEEAIEKIWGKNVMRVFEEVQAVAESMQAKTLS